MGLLQPESGLLFWMVISFGVVFVLLAKFGFPVITRMVEERRVYVEKSLEAAKQANEQLAGIKSESEALLQKAREEQMRILNEGQKQLEEAKRQIRLEKEAAIREVRGQIAMLSVDIAEKVIRGKLDSSPAQMTMIERMLDEMPSMKQ